MAPALQENGCASINELVHFTRHWVHCLHDILRLCVDTNACASTGIFVFLTKTSGVDSNYRKAYHKSPLYIVDFKAYLKITQVVRVAMLVCPSLEASCIFQRDDAAMIS
jgi:hypothetical protein